MKLRNRMGIAICCAMIATLVVPAVKAAGVTIRPTWNISTSDALMRNQTVVFAVTLARSGRLATLRVQLPSGSKARYPHFWTNTHRGTLRATAKGYRFDVAKPYRLRAGRRILLEVGFATPPPGRYRAWIAAGEKNGRSLGGGYTVARTFATATPCKAMWSPDDIAIERARTGTPTWRLKAPYSASHLSAYANHASVQCGDVVTLRIHSSESSVSIEAYRSEYYGGVGARRVWAGTGPALAWRQPTPRLVKSDSSGREIDMVSASNWAPTFALRIDGRFVPGPYLLKLSTRHYQAYVPLTVRDAGAHKYLVLNSVATWQTYNSFGGLSAYTSPASRRISYDRPYLAGEGAGDYLKNEMGFAFWASKQGLDVGYTADIDLDASPQWLDKGRVLVLLSHTEYWSIGMRNAVDNARSRGMKLLSLGANQAFWRIIPQSSPVTGRSREHEIFRSGTTGMFRSTPSAQPEQLLLGAMYGCLRADGTTTPNGSWLWQGIQNLPLPHMAHGEVDRVMAEYPPAPGTQILTTTPLDACGHPDLSEWHSDIVSVDDGVQGRVVSFGSEGWVCALVATCGYPVANETAIAAGQAVMNALAWLDNGAQPSAAEFHSSNQRSFRYQQIGHIRPTVGMPDLDSSTETSP